MIIVILSEAKNLMPRLYIISGPNGSGKTTASYGVLPELLDCSEFVKQIGSINNQLSTFICQPVTVGFWIIREAHTLG